MKPNARNQRGLTLWQLLICVLTSALVAAVVAALILALTQPIH